MSTKRSVGRITATQEKDRTASKSKKNRSINLCAFTFADGRQCRTPRRSGHLHLCYFHAQKEAQSLAAQQVGQDISRFLPTKLLTACDLGVAMSRLFCAVAQGQIKPKVASTLAYLAQTMLQSIPIAQDEYIHSFDTDTWRSAVRASFRHQDPDDADDRADTDDDPVDPPAEDAADAPALQHTPKPPASASAPTANSASSPAPQPSAQPAPSPHTPLPRTSTEFAQRVLAGRNSSLSEIPTLPGPGRETGSADSPSSSDPSPSATTPTCSSTNQIQPRPAPQSTSPQQSQPTQNHQHNSQPAPTPPASSSVPPGFGAPANWDVLIPPKPRRRFSRF